MRGQLVPQEGKGCDDSRASIRVGDEIPHLTYADRSEAKPDRCNAGNDACVLGSDVAAVFDQTGLRVSLLPEEKEASIFEIV